MRWRFSAGPLSLTLLLFDVSFALSSELPGETRIASDIAGRYDRIPWDDFEFTGGWSMSAGSGEAPRSADEARRGVRGMSAVQDDGTRMIYDGVAIYTVHPGGGGAWTFSRFVLLETELEGATPPGSRDLFRIAYEGMRRNPVGWFRNGVKEITHVYEIGIPSEPRFVQRSRTQMQFDAVVVFDRVTAAGDGLETVSERYAVHCNEKEGLWLFFKADPLGALEILGFWEGGGTRVAALPTLMRTSLEEIYGRRGGGMTGDDAGSRGSGSAPR